MRLFGKTAAIFIFIAIISSGCKKSSTSCQVPNVLVDITVYTTDPQYYKLNAVGGAVSIIGGNRGIIVYQQSLGVYVAFDRTCTYMPSSANAIIHIDTTNYVTAIDSSCGSKFSLYDGSVLKGPAACPLKQYNTSVSGSAIHIYSQ